MHCLNSKINNENGGKFMKKFFKEFKTFITRGNVLDMAVGVIVGGAFTAIVNALSNNILKPVINWVLTLIFGQDSLSNIYTYLKKVYIKDALGNATTEIDLTQSIYIDWGSFINAIINFIIIAFVLFCIVKAINKVQEQTNEAKQKLKDKYKKEEPATEEVKEEPVAVEEPAPAPAPVVDENIELLKEIRDLLKENASSK